MNGRNFPACVEAGKIFNGMGEVVGYLPTIIARTATGEWSNYGSALERRSHANPFGSAEEAMEVWETAKVANGLPQNPVGMSAEAEKFIKENGLYRLASD